MTSTSEVTAPAQAQAASNGRLSLINEIIRRPNGAFGLFIVSALVIVLLFAEVLAPYGPAEQDIPNRLQGPSETYLLGTDHLGRDLLSRLLFGTRVALGTAFPAVLVALAAGLVLGLVSGYVGGIVDSVLLVIMDSIQAFPTVLLALALLTLLGPSQANVIVALAVARAPRFGRIVRAQVLAIKENPFVEAERSLGASTVRIILVHILPNILAPLVILLAMNVPSAIVTEAGLSFLGVGVRPPTPSWGVILADGFTWLRTSPWAVVWTGLTLSVTTLGFTLFGETLRDILDPKLSGARRVR
jgi:peptide/nickel transport system permease protein